MEECCKGDFVHGSDGDGDGVRRKAIVRAVSTAAAISASASCAARALAPTRSVNSDAAARRNAAASEDEVRQHCRTCEARVEVNHHHRATCERGERRTSPQHPRIDAATRLKSTSHLKCRDTDESSAQKSFFLHSLWRRVVRPSFHLLGLRFIAGSMSSHPSSHRASHAPSSDSGPSAGVLPCYPSSPSQPVRSKP